MYVQYNPALYCTSTYSKTRNTVAVVPIIDHHRAPRTTHREGGGVPPWRWRPAASACMGYALRYSSARDHGGADRPG